MFYLSESSRHVYELTHADEGFYLENRSNSSLPRLGPILFNEVHERLLRDYQQPAIEGFAPCHKSVIETNRYIPPSPFVLVSSGVVTSFSPLKLQEELQAARQAAAEAQEASRLLRQQLADAQRQIEEAALQHEEDVRRMGLLESYASTIVSDLKEANRKKEEMQTQAEQDQQRLALAEPRAGVYKYRELTEIAELGRGSFGKVFSARLPEGVEVAVKEITGSSDRERSEQMRQEAIMLERLQHENIIRLLGVCLSRPSLVMELGGVNLRKFLKYQAPSLPGRFKIAMGCVEAIHYMHGKGAIHRDIKPDNIVMQGDGHVKIVDFGLSRFLNSEGVIPADSLMGSPAYVAPELLAEKRVFPSRETDVYSLCVTLLEILIPGELYPQYKNVNDTKLFFDAIRQGCRPATASKACVMDLPEQTMLLLFLALIRPYLDLYDDSPVAEPVNVLLSKREQKALPVRADAAELARSLQEIWDKKDPVVSEMFGAASGSGFFSSDGDTSSPLASQLP